jgi:putative PIG3 family NAD(P)H quinone oxidoreductase
VKAVYIKEFGVTENLVCIEVPEPTEPNEKVVHVRVHAAGLYRADLLQVRGHYPPPAGYSPNIPGLEFAGEVIAVGSNVDKWKAGDRVFGITAGEAQAEKLLIHEDLIARIPDGLSYTEAAAVPEAFITAHDAIFTRGRLARGETLLIHAAGSGVGLASLQIAKQAGATVIGTSRTADKLDKCREFGLDAGMTTGDEVKFAAAVNEAIGGRGADVILDLVGAAYFAENMASLADKGRLILVGLPSGSKTEFDLGMALSKRATIVGTVLRPRSIEEKAEAVKLFADEVVPLLASGVVEPNVDRVFAASEVRAAYEYLGSNRSFGKVVLEF